MARSKSHAARNAMVALALGTGMAFAPNVAKGQTASAQAAPLATNSVEMVNASMTTTFATRYVKAGGGAVGEGPVNQNTFDVNLGNGQGLMLTGTVWTDYNFGTEKTDEVDLDATVSDKFAFIGNGPFKGTLTTSLAFQDWKYPSGLEGSHDDYVLLPTIAYNGPVTLKLMDYHLLDDHWSWDRNMVRVDLSKTFDVAKLWGGTLSVTPGIRTAYNDNFGKCNGYRYVAPSITVAWTRGAWTVSGFLRHQSSVSEVVKTFDYYGISVSISDLGKGFRQLLRE